MKSLAAPGSLDVRIEVPRSAVQGEEEEVRLVSLIQSNQTSLPPPPASTASDAIVKSISLVLGTPTRTLNVNQLRNKIAITFDFAKEAQAAGKSVEDVSQLLLLHCCTRALTTCVNDLQFLGVYCLSYFRKIYNICQKKH